MLNLAHVTERLLTVADAFEATDFRGVPAQLEATELGFASALAVLSRFKELMELEGIAVDTHRMVGDSGYAFEQLALGHTSDSERMRQCAMRLFALFHA
jgi:hypothetical protein